MSKCKGIMGVLFGHDYEEIFDEAFEYYEQPDQLRAGPGPVKKESVTHLYCICRRCGEQVSKERKSLFTKETA